MRKWTAIFVMLCTQYSYTQQHEIYTLSESIKNKMIIKFIGEYYSGKIHHQLLPGEMTRWKKLNGFKIKKKLIGSIPTNEIEMDAYNTVLHLKNGSIHESLIDGKTYEVQLQLDKSRLKMIDTNTKGLKSLHVMAEEIMMITPI